MKKKEKEKRHWAITKLLYGMPKLGFFSLVETQFSKCKSVFVYVVVTVF
jgi:hypothetical protein